jgi:hypothetical protein
MTDIYSQLAMGESTHLFVESNACLQSHLRHVVIGEILDGENIKQLLPVVSWHFFSIGFQEYELEQ